MILHRKTQILDGLEFHYILINIFEVNEKIDFDKYFPIKLMKSDYFKVDAQIDSKKSMNEEERNEYLPFPFHTDKIDLTDFKQINSVTNKSLINELNLIYKKEFEEIEVTNEFHKGYKYLMDLLEKTLNDWKGKSTYYLLTIGDFENDSYKIHSLYHDMNFIYDYFYFVIGINEEINEVIVFELGYE